MVRASETAVRAELNHLLRSGRDAGADDAYLLARFAERRDEASFAALVARHGAMVLATARAVLRHEQDAEDAFQATFLTLARRAGSIRAGATLGAWLHRVAHRSALAALAASRSRQRRQAIAAPDLQARALRQAVDRRVDPDAWATLHAEVERLPERQRRAVVLVDLEGLTYDEAASRLGWTEPSLRNRLATARARLRVRLARRGLAPGSWLALGGFGPRLQPLPLPLVPPELARRATLGALGGASVAASVRLIVRTLATTTLMRSIATTLLASLTIATLGVVGGLPRPAPAPAKEPPPAPAPPAVRADEPRLIRGRVINPAGQAVAGAEVQTSLNQNQPNPPTVVRTDADGAFALPVSPRFFEGGSARGLRALLATAPGFGPGWTIDTDRPDVVIRLVPPGPPVEGRLLRPDGQPLAGASVRLVVLAAPVAATTPQFEAANLDAYLADDSDRELYKDMRSLGGERATTTDDDGRFRFADLGANRLMSLAIEHPDVRRTLAYCVTVPTLPTPAPVRRVGMAHTSVTLQSARFEFRCQPMRPITGTITDQATSRPLPNWTMRGADAKSQVNLNLFNLTATTNECGQFRLTGLGVVPSYRVILTPPDGAPYLPAVFREVQAPRDEAPLTVNHIARRGLLIQGHILDAETGQPVAGRVDLDTFADNPNLKDYPGFAESHGTSCRIRSTDGHFEILAPPGRIMLCVRADDEERYPMGQGDAAAAADLPFPRRLVLRSLHAMNYHFLAVRDVPPGLNPEPIDLRIAPNRRVNLTVVDPEGRPVRKFDVQGLRDLLMNQPVDQDGPTVALHAARPDRPRRVVVREHTRKLVGSIVLSAADTDRTLPPLVLQPWGEVRGRVVDDAGHPRTGLGLCTGGNLADYYQPLETTGIIPNGTRGGGVPLDDSAEFHLVGLVPGLHYEASALGPDKEGMIGRVFEDLVVKPGEIRDLGDLRVQRFRKR